MFDAGSLLGGMLNGGVRRRRKRHRAPRVGIPGLGNLGGVAGGVAGVAAIGGLAYLAYQAYQGSKQAPAGTPMAPPGAYPGGVAPYAPPAAVASAQDPNLGYPPGIVPYYLQEQQRQAAAAPPVPPPTPSVPIDRATAVLLIRAMIAAANADGAIDQEERQEITEHLGAVGLGAAERQALDYELAHPRPPSALLAEIRTPALAEQVYAVSLLAIDPDTEAEHAYLRGLAAMLNLAPAVTARIEAAVAAPAT